MTMVKEESFSNYIIRTLSVQPSANQHHYIQVCIVRRGEGEYWDRNKEIEWTFFIMKLACGFEMFGKI